MWQEVLLYGLSLDGEVVGAVEIGRQLINECGMEGAVLLPDAVLGEVQLSICCEIGFGCGADRSQRFLLLALHVLPEEFQLLQGFPGGVIGSLVCPAEGAVGFRDAGVRLDFYG